MSNNKNNFDGDLDEFVKKLFGNKKGSKEVKEVPKANDAEQQVNSGNTNGKKAPTPLKKDKKPINVKQWVSSAIVLTVVFAALIVVFANLYIVKENEYKVVRQFGEVVKYESEPGLHMKIPFIQSVTTLPSNLMTHDMTEEEISTKDKKRIIIDNYTVWRVTDPKALISNAGQLLNAENRMEEFIYSALRTEFGQTEYGDIINEKDSKRGNINDRVTQRVNELIDSANFGIEVIDVRIRRTDLPEENEQSVYTRMVSERQSIAQKYLSEGDAEKRSKEAKTDQEVQVTLAKANKEASVIRAEGEAQAAQIYNAAYSKDPEFYSLFRTLESYKKTIGNETMIIIPSDSPYAKLLSGQID
ncbi:protease modulator HflC [Solibacillus sp. FSL W7-1472]|uniref:protease modulator HflC n=1 Tax=Solibacillus sp. FSL W7-1472 TaxID=2921707 RepID=UPI0030DBD6D7